MKRYAKIGSILGFVVVASALLMLRVRAGAEAPIQPIGWGSPLIQRRADESVALENMKAIHFLNRLVGNQNKPGGVLSEGPMFDPLAGRRTTRPPTWRPVTRRTLGRDSISALLVHDLNVAYSAPWSAETLKSIPLVVSFSSFMDETTRHSDLILPDHSFLESWDIRVSHPLQGGPAVSLAQPVVKPELNTRQTADVLIAIGRHLEIPLPFESAE